MLAKGDVGDPALCRSSFDVLVSNATFQQRCPAIEDLTDEQFDYLAKGCVLHVRPGSAIVATGSETGLFGSAVLLDDSATKRASPCAHAFAGSGERR